MTGLKLFLLGPPRGELNGAPVDLQRRKALALLVYLAVSGQAHSRDSLATFFWPELDQQRGRAYLRRDLAALNTRLPGHWLIADRETVELNREASPWLDIEKFHSLLAACREHGHALEIVCADCVPLLTEAVTLYTGDFLAGFTLRDSPEFDDWQFFQTEGLRQELATALERLVRGLNAQGKADAAIPHARRWVVLNPLHEPAQHQLIQVYYQAGQVAAALRQYETYVKLLDEELGLPPEDETATLYEAIKAKRIFAPFIKAEEQRGKEAAEREKIEVQNDTSTSPQGPRFVARQQELIQLDAFLEAALRGDHRVVFVTGEAGQGKSALLQAFARRAQVAHSDLVCASGSCNAYTGIGDPYLPFREILELLTGAVEAQTAAGMLPAEQAERLRYLLPHSIGVLVREGPHLLDTFIPAKILLNRVATYTPRGAPWLDELQALVSLKLKHSDSPAVQQAALFEQYLKVIQALSRQTPLLLLLDDLQWADRGSINLLFHLGRRLAGHRVLIVGAYRPAEVAIERDGQRHPLEFVVNEFQRHFGYTSLNLAQAEGEAFVNGLLDSEPNRFNDSFRSTLFQLTEGHPLFTIELLRGMQERGDLIHDEAGRWVEQPGLDWQKLPARVEGAIGERISRLAQPLRELLRVASVEGEEFTAEVAARVLGVDVQVVVRQLSRELDKRHQLIQAQGLKREGALRLSRYRFRHILIQRYLYQSLDEVERVHLNEAIGNAFEALYAEQTDPIAIQLAWHYQEAGILEKAVYYLLQAGRRASRLSANEEAIAHLQQCLTLLRLLPDTPERVQQELDVQIALGPVLVAARGYSVPEVKQTYSRARELIRHGQETPELFWVLIGLWGFYLVRAELQTTRELGEQALVLASRLKDPVLLLEAHRVLGMTLFHLGEFALAREQLEQGAHLYDPQQHRSLAFLSVADPGVACLAYLARTLWHLGFPDQALEKIYRALDLAQDLSHPFSLAAARVYTARVHQCCRDAQATLEQAETAIALSMEQGFPHYISMGTILRGWATAQQGDVEAGIIQIRDGLAAGDSTQIRIARTHFLAMLAEAHCQAGQVEEGLNVLAEALTSIEQSFERQWQAELYRLKGELLLLVKNGDHNQAEITASEDCFLKALTLARQQGSKALELRAVLSLGRLWHIQGSPSKSDEARQLLEEVYGWFTEGFETADLQEAKTLLEELGSQIKPRSKVESPPTPPLVRPSTPLSSRSGPTSPPR